MPDFDLGQRYALCEECDAPGKFLRRAMAAHPATRHAGNWTAALFVFVDAKVQPWLLVRSSESGSARA